MINIADAGRLGEGEVRDLTPDERVTEPEVGLRYEVFCEVRGMRERGWDL